MIKVEPGDMVELVFPGRTEDEKYFGYYQYFHPLRQMHWIVAKKGGKAGWLVEPEQIVRVVKNKSQRKRRS